MPHPMRKISLILVGGLCLASCAGEPTATPDPSSSAVGGPPADVAATLNTRIPELMAATRIPALSTCVITGSEIAWCAAFGITDVAGGIPANFDTQFQAASLSKPVFAYTVLLLADRGILDLDRPLTSYVGIDRLRELHLGSAFDDPRIDAITARMVLTHTTGFPNWRRNGRLEFLFDPGDRFGYSGEGFGLLQQVMEEITGSPLEDLVRTNTFEPLEMTSSTYTPSRIDLANYAWPHDGAGNADLRPEDLEARLAKARPHAAASLTTTSTDYARFLIALINGTGLEPATFSDLIRSHVDVDDGTGVAWGLGTGLERSSTGNRVWHWGDNQDTKAFFVADPATGNGLVYFANSFNGLSIVSELLAIAMPGDHPLLDGALLSSYPAYDSPEFAFTSAVYQGGAAAAVAAIRRFQDGAETIPVSERTVNSMGYWLIGEDRIDEAITLFELNIELYPEAWNAYDSLGEAQLQAGLRDEALANYRRSLELNPENRGARKILEDHGETID